MTKELERAGIPTVQVTNLSKIAEGIGSGRILQGNSVVHVLGNPALPDEREKAYRKQMTQRALEMLEKEPPEGQHSLVEI